MREFIWIGINNAGQKISGKISAENKIAAKTIIEKNDIALISIKKNYANLFSAKQKFTHKQRLDFTQQLQLLLQASIPLSDSLALIAKTSQDKIIQVFSAALQEKIISGTDFATALTDFPNHFTKTDCQMIAAGEKSGQLDIALTQLIENQEQRLQLKSKIGKALFYPLSVLCIAIIIAAGLIIFVIPQFQSIYSNFGARLPMMTCCLISMSHYLSQHGLFYLVILTILFLILKKILSEHYFLKNKMGQLFLKLPFVRTLLITKHVAEWSQLLAMMLSAGIPLVDALQIANQVISQPVFAQQMLDVRTAVIAGKSLHIALDICHYFPVRAKTMIAIAENADALPFMMKKIAILYQNSLNETLDRLSKLLEPVIMITVASLVSGLIIAMYLPIFKMGSVV
ncbi:MAG TPA: type II secretion system F family protein [Coxiellaceae bacterium]|nr:MAG: hypothetical protein A3E81_03630 [Gammaproteobacteria bacterium RIFCSPHIGHO2_12_FULL_36_30]HLB56155.1 type II secretion system F family protein [Coxiellaceae bacterium]